MDNVSTAPEQPWGIGMYMVAFMYPAGDGREFNLQHFLDVHLPLGVGLTKKHLGLTPIKIVVYAPTGGANGSNDSARYCAISSVFFENCEQAEKFVTLFEVEEAAMRLTADFPNYTPAPPELLVSKVTELNDMQSLITQFESMEGS